MSLDDIKRGKRKTRMDAAENAMLHLNTEVDTNVPPMRPRRLAQMPVRERRSPVTDVHHVTSPQEAEQRQPTRRDRQRIPARQQEDTMPSISPGPTPPDRSALDVGRESTLPPLEREDISEREEAEAAAGALADPREASRLRGMRDADVDESYITERQEAEQAAESMRIPIPLPEEEIQPAIPPKTSAYLKLRQGEDVMKDFQDVYAKRMDYERTGDVDKLRDYAKAEEKFMKSQRSELTGPEMESLIQSYKRAESGRESRRKKDPTELEQLDQAADILKIEPSKPEKGTTKHFGDISSEDITDMAAAGEFAAAGEREHYKQLRYKQELAKRGYDTMLPEEKKRLEQMQKEAAEIMKKHKSQRITEEERLRRGDEIEAAKVARIEKRGEELLKHPVRKRGPKDFQKVRSGMRKAYKEAEIKEKKPKKKSTKKSKTSKKGNQ